MTCQWTLEACVSRGRRHGLDDQGPVLFFFFFFLLGFALPRRVRHAPIVGSDSDGSPEGDLSDGMCLSDADGMRACIDGPAGRAWRVGASMGDRRS